jgi:hypothetical protein
VAIIQGPATSYTRWTWSRHRRVGDGAGEPFYRWKGSSWNEAGGAQPRRRAMLMLSATDGWAVGWGKDMLGWLPWDLVTSLARDLLWRGCGSLPASLGGWATMARLCHYDGSVWSSVALARHRLMGIELWRRPPWLGGGRLGFVLALERQRGRNMATALPKRPFGASRGDEGRQRCGQGRGRGRVRLLAEQQRLDGSCCPTGKTVDVRDISPMWWAWATMA